MKSVHSVSESELFGLKFRRIDLDGVVKWVAEKINEDNSYAIHTVNVDHLCIRDHDTKFGQSMKSADLLVADGMPLVWYSRLVASPLPERITGVDLSYRLCELSRQLDLRIFLLGARPGVAEKAINKLVDQYGDVNIGGFYSPSREEILNEEKSIEIIQDIKRSGSNVLLVAFGAPLQEIWINQYRNELKGIVSIGVGATLDFMAGNVKRAPTWVQHIGFEWLFRLISEPRRLVKRYLIRDLIFFRICSSDLLSRLGL